ncbi:MAG TPA: YihY/virulence factor BrkB family protein [Anaerolineales bacterium]|nr:YihY/virulence factor BrkB family protein [Anaerolineales bacterium]
MLLERVFSRNNLERVGKVLVQTFKHFTKDNAPQWAAAIAYYSLLSIFPLLLAGVAIAAYFVDQQWAIEQSSRLIRGLVPSGTQFLRETIESIIESRGQVGFLSIMILIWSGSRVFGVITRALNIAYHVSEPYSFFRRTLIELLMTFTIGVLFVLSLGWRLLITFIEGIVQISFFEGQVFYQFLSNAVSAALLLLSLFLIYLYVPRRRVAWWAALAGATLFTVLFLLAQPLFTGYIQTFANYSLVYGPLAIVITLLLWIWISANLLLLGGELASHIQDRLVEEKSEKEVEEQHEERDPTSPTHEQPLH